MAVAADGDGEQLVVDDGGIIRRQSNGGCSGVGAGLQVLGSVGSTIANVQASDVNTKQLDAKARSIDQQTDFDVMQQRRDNTLFLGEQNANAVASGVAITSGSPLLKELDRVKQTEMQAQNIRASGQNAAAATRFQSKMTRRQIPFQIFGGAAQGGSSILISYAGK